jgi:hypothetical protein
MFFAVTNSEPITPTGVPRICVPKRSKGTANRGCFAPLVIGTLVSAALATVTVDDGWLLWIPALLALATVRSMLAALDL